MLLRNESVIKNVFTKCWRIYNNILLHLFSKCSCFLKHKIAVVMNGLFMEI